LAWFTVSGDSDFSSIHKMHMAITHGLVFLTDYHHDYKSSVLNIRRTIEHMNDPIEHMNDALRSLSYKYTAHFSECAKLEHCFYLRPHLGIKAWMLTALSSNEYDGLQIIAEEILYFVIGEHVYLAVEGIYLSHVPNVNFTQAIFR
jgi:hypothetical protein